ncbi:hypothetical protein BBI17_008545 [Phytophthora kernoviae]|uniref:Peptidase S1 domain-containing protein n=1 Tax=Phytophthora kernoviae TaxID=325452 RepID=A0A3R7FZJ5_9STRA|nr:hypothetical protein BBI17_008545 [Phytophthora kernoviae]
MKTVFTLAILLVCATFPVNTDGSNIERKLIVGGDVVPVNAKTYMTGLRATIGGNSFCGGSLISPTHVLTASHCVVYDIRWASIGSHFRNGTQDGEQIRVISIMNHPNYQENVLNSDDFLVLELAKPSSFKPVKLAAADDSDFKAGKWATTMGWGTNAETNDINPYELQRVDVQLASDEACANYATVDSSMRRVPPRHCAFHEAYKSQSCSYHSAKGVRVKPSTLL